MKGQISLVAIATQIAGSVDSSAVAVALRVFLTGTLKQCTCAAVVTIRSCAAANNLSKFNDLYCFSLLHSPPSLSLPASAHLPGAMSTNTPAAATDRLVKKLSANKSIEKARKAGKAGPSSSAASSPIVPPPKSPASVQAPPSSGDDARDKARTLLANALFKEDEDIVPERSAVFPVVVEIETAMFEQLGGVSNDYKLKLRELKFNFKDKKNGDLRSEVLSRSLEPKAVVKMTSKDLANAEKKEERRKLHEFNLREAAAGNKQEASTSEFRCGKCKERKCTYFQMQTRGADEPLTTFVHCVNCNNRWKF